METMEELLQIYIKKDIKYCAGCLHTETVAKLSNMQNFDWLFKKLFANLFLFEELEKSWICSWCIRRLYSARIFSENFRKAQYLLTKISTDINLFKTSLDLRKDLCFQINDLKNRSRLNSNTLCEISNANDLVIDNNYDVKIKNKKIEVNSFVKKFENSNVLHRKSYSKRTEKIKRQDKMLKTNGNSNEYKNCVINNQFQEHNREIDIKARQTNNVSIFYKEEPKNMTCIRKSKIKIKNKHTKHLESDTEPNIYQQDILKVTKKDFILTESEKTCIKYDPSNSNILQLKNKKVTRYLPRVERIKCNLCDRLFIKNIALERHILRQHKKKYTCINCDRNFPNKLQLINHTVKVHEVKSGTFECNVCGIVYKQRLKMIQHLNHHRKYGPSLEDLNKIICDHCGKICNRRNIKIHLVMHRDEKDFECTICNERFKLNQLLQYHIQRKHMDREIGFKYSCEHCKKKFINSTRLKYHVNSIHLKKGQLCSLCSKCFQTKGRLQKHIQNVHEKVPKKKDKQCDFCEKAFSDTVLLRRHHYTHTGEKPYACDLCTAAYNQKYCLTVHKLRTHNISNLKNNN